MQCKNLTNENDCFVNRKTTIGTDYSLNTTNTFMSLLFHTSHVQNSVIGGRTKGKDG